MKQNPAGFFVETISFNILGHWRPYRHDRSRKSEKKFDLETF